MATEKFYAVDRMERKYVVLIGDAGDEVTVARAELPARLKEGMVLRVPVGEQGDLDWPAARMDQDETERRRREAERIIRDLRRRDPGGDIEL